MPIVAAQGHDPLFAPFRGNQYRYGNSSRKFAIIDSYVHERLAILMSRKHGLQGRNWAGRYNQAWYQRLGVHRLSGTVRYGPAHA